MTGLVSGDTLTETFTTTATNISPAGIYTIVPAAAGARLSNYTQLVTNGILTVAPAPLIATASNATRVYGIANPVLAGFLSGVVNGEALLANYSTTAQSTDAAGQYPIIASVTGSALGNYSLSVVSGVLTVQKAGTSTTLNQEGAPAADGTVQLQAHVVSATTGAPSGTVRFYNGKQLLGEATLQNGVAAYSTNQLSIGGTSPLVAIYQADTNFLASSSDALPILVKGSGFWIKPAETPLAVTVHTGEPAAFSLNVEPGTAGIYPGVVTFAVTGLPQGATATFSPATLAANSGSQTVAMTVQTKVQAASASGVAHTTGSWKPLPLVGGSALALVLLPLAEARRLRKAGIGMLLTLLLVLGSIASSTALTGCGATRNTAWGNTANTQPITYVLTVTMTSGGVQRAATESLILQP